MQIQATKLGVDSEVARVVNSTMCLDEQDFSVYLEIETALFYFRN